MINKLIFEGPLNNLSMGNVSINILHSLYKKKIEVLYLPIGNADIGNYNTTEDFRKWLENAAQSFLKNFDRNLPHLKNWHLNGSHAWVSNKRYLLTYHECDQATTEELNIVKNIDKVFFCGNYSPSIFKDVGANNVYSFNLGFDDSSFNKTNKTYLTDNRIQWLLTGKTEKRKGSLQLLSLWAKKFGMKMGESYKQGDQIHFLNCCIINPFYDVKAQEQQIAQILDNQRYINIQFFPFLGREQYNDLYNACHVDLTGLSFAESWNLPSFNMTCLGKWSIVLNATGHKTWANKDNCILVNPNGKQSIVDGIFFHPNTPFNTGNCYAWDEKDVLAAMDLAVQKVKIPNLEGEKLATEFTYDKTVDYILKEMES